MNYQNHYAALITRSKVRVIKGYSEKHHVLPRCMGGGDDVENIAILTAREHFVAHQLLLKLHHNVQGLVFAAHRMTCDANGERVNNRKYKWLREKHSSAMSNVMREYYANSEVRERRATQGRERLRNNPEHVAKLRSAQANPVSRAKAAASLRATLATPQGRARKIAAAIEVGSRPEQKARLSKLLKDRHDKDGTLRDSARAGYTVESERKRLETFKATLESSDAKLRFSNAAKARWLDPVIREKATAAIRRGYADGSRSMAGANNSRARGVIQLDTNGIVAGEFDTIAIAARANGLDRHTVSDRITRSHPLWKER